MMNSGSYYQTLREKSPYLELFWSTFSNIWTEQREILREKVFEQERYENKKGKSRVVTTNYIQQKGGGKVKDWDDEILGFDFVFDGQNDIDFNLIS